MVAEVAVVAAVAAVDATDTKVSLSGHAFVVKNQQRHFLFCGRTFSKVRAVQRNSYIRK